MVTKKGEKAAEKRSKGRPRAFETAEDFENKFNAYIDYCIESKRFANIAGFCRFAHITRETLYKQQEYYSDSYNIVMDILEDEVLQDNTYRAQLYLKAKFGYTETQKVEATNLNINDDVSGMTKEEITAELEKMGFKKV